MDRIRSNRFQRLSVSNGFQPKPARAASPAKSSPRTKKKLAPQFAYDLHMFGELIRLLRAKMERATKEERLVTEKRGERSQIS